MQNHWASFLMSFFGPSVCLQKLQHCRHSRVQHGGKSLELHVSNSLQQTEPVANFLLKTAAAYSFFLYYRLPNIRRQRLPWARRHDTNCPSSHPRSGSESQYSQLNWRSPIQSVGRHFKVENRRFKGASASSSGESQVQSRDRPFKVAIASSKIMYP